MPDTRQWLEDLGLARYADAFEKHEVEWESLPDLTNELLKEMGIVAVGARMKILKAAAQLDISAETPPTPTQALPKTSSTAGPN